MSGDKISDVTWQEPPKRMERGRYDWAKIADQLEANPNEWALIFHNDLTSLATSIRINGIRALRQDQGIELRTANNVREPVRRCSLYLRYVPEKDKRRAVG